MAHAAWAMLRYTRAEAQSCHLVCACKTSVTVHDIRCCCWTSVPRKPMQVQHRHAVGTGSVHGRRSQALPLSASAT